LLSLEKQFSFDLDMKSTWPFLLGLLLLAAPATVQAQLTYTINGGTVTITGYYGIGPFGVLIIPATLDNLPVTGIADDAFNDLDSVTNVTIPGSVTNIGNGAFSGCADLTAITVDATNPVYSSTNGVLFDKAFTTLVEYPGGLAGSYTIPGSVSNIGVAAFEQCYSLASVTIPGSVIHIGDDAFNDCTSLTAITVDATNSFYSSVEGVLFDKNQSTLIEYPGGLAGGYTIPDSVSKIGVAAFDQCHRLTSVTIPGSVTGIGDDAFNDCTTLTAMTVDATNSFYSSVDGVLFDKNQTTLIEYPGGLAGNYTIPGSVTRIGEDAFQNCNGLTSITIPGSVSNIGAGAFGSCYSLANLTITMGVTSIESNAFEQCYSLASVTIPGSVTNIGDGAFNYCLSLTSVTIPDSVASIGEEAFEYCSSLTGVTISDSVTYIAEGEFGYCSSLTSVTIPGSVASIGPYAFYECADLTNVTIPGSVSNIGIGAFEQCYTLTSVTIPGSVTSIGDYAFSQTPVTNFYFAGNAPAVDSSAFDSVANPTVYYLPGTIGWVEFSANTGVSAALWNPVIQTRDGGFGVRNNQFGFNITGPTNLVVVVEACGNLAGPVWTPIETVTLVNGLFRFSEPMQTNISRRFYGLGLP
jgi:hypothetical protein